MDELTQTVCNNYKQRRLGNYGPNSTKYCVEQAGAINAIITQSVVSKSISIITSGAPESEKYCNCPVICYVCREIFMKSPKRVLTASRLQSPVRIMTSDVDATEDCSHRSLEQNNDWLHE